MPTRNQLILANIKNTIILLFVPPNFFISIFFLSGFTMISSELKSDGVAIQGLFNDIYRYQAKCYQDRDLCAAMEVFIYLSKENRKARIRVVY